MEKEKIRKSLLDYFEAEPEKKFTVQELADKMKMNKAGQFNFIVHWNLNIKANEDYALAA